MNNLFGKKSVWIVGVLVIGLVLVVAYATSLRSRNGTGGGAEDLPVDALLRTAPADTSATDFVPSSEDPPESTVPGEYREGTFLLGKQLEGERIFHSPGSVIKISPDGRRYWNIVFSKQGERIGAREFIDGNEIRSYTISSGYPMDPHQPDVIVSFNDQQAGYIVLSNGSYVITNGLESGPYRGVGKFSLTPQDQIAYVAIQNDTGYLIVNGIQVGPEGIFDFQYSLDGKQLAHVIIDSDKKYHLFLDDKEIAVYGHIEELTFSPDGKKLAYIARNEHITQPGDFFVVVNGEKQKPYEFIRSLTFTPDGIKLVYSASDGPDRSPEKRVLDGMEGQDYPWISGYVFSPDSSRFAYTALNKLAGVKNETLVIVDDQVVRTYPGKAGGEEGNYAYTRNFISGMTFSPDSQHFAYLVNQDTRYDSRKYIVVDGHEEEVTYDSVQNLAFTSDGEYIRYNGMKGSKIYLVVEKY